MSSGASLADLNQHLHAQLERLGKEGLRGQDLKEEVTRAMAIKEVAKVVVENAKVALEAEMWTQGGKKLIPKMLQRDSESLPPSTK